MRDCASILPLVEKLSDLEATASEKAAVEAHLEKCPSCRRHAEFLASLVERTRELSFPEPPPSYWEHLPRRVLDRIDSEKRRRPRLWGLPVWAPVAVLLVVAAVSLSILREELSSPTASPPAAAPASAAEPATPPPMARDEAVPEVARSEPPRAQERVEEAIPAGPSPAVPAEAAVSFESADEVRPALQKENAPELARVGRPQSAAARSSSGRPEDCGELRRLADEDEGAPADIRYRLALCSLGREMNDENRRQAIEDAEAFLAIEKEGPKAEEIREKLRRIQPD